MSETTPSPPSLHGTQLIILAVAVCLCSLQIILDTSIIATAIPSITDRFGTVQDVDWYGSAYLLVLCAIGPLTGQLYSLFRIKATYLTFIFFFMLGNLVAGVAQSSRTLIIGRAITGLGAAGVMTGNMVAISISTTSSMRTQLINLSIVMVGIGGAVGPVVGGAITQHIGWRWCLWIFLPVAGCTGALFAVLRIPNIVHKTTFMETLRNIPQKVDFVGFFLFTPASVMLLIATSWGGSKFAWDSSTIIGLLAGSVVAAAGFAIWMGKHKERALIPPHILLRPVVLAAGLLAYCQGMSFFMLSYYLPLWFQSVKGASPQASGIMLLPTCIAQIVAGIASGALMRFLPYASVWAIFGNATTAIGAGLMTTFLPSTSEGSWIGYQILAGIGRGVAFQMPLLAVQELLPQAEMAIATATILFFQYFGGALGVNVAKTVFANALRSALVQFAPRFDPTTIIDAGATKVQQLSAEHGTNEIVHAYNKALALTFWLPTTASIAGFFLSFGLGWKKLAAATKQPDEGSPARSKEHSNRISNQETK